MIGPLRQSAFSVLPGSNIAIGVTSTVANTGGSAGIGGEDEPPPPPHPHNRLAAPHASIIRTALIDTLMPISSSVTTIFVAVSSRRMAG
jgi:hypothetical protein